MNEILTILINLIVNSAVYLSIVTAKVYFYFHFFLSISM